MTAEHTEPHYYVLPLTLGEVSGDLQEVNDKTGYHITKEEHLAFRAKLEAAFRAMREVGYNCLADDEKELIDRNL